jgi:DNA-binding Xre family transcriptional regulator
MAMSYKKLWKLLIDKDMNKVDLMAATGISNYTISKMSRSENVTTTILGRICKVLDCNIGDICDVIPDVDSENAEGAE